MRWIVWCLGLYTVDAIRLLAMSKTVGFRHDSIYDALNLLRAMQPVYNFSVDFTEDSNVFTTENLSKYDALVFVMTSGDIFNQEQQQALIDYMHSGGGFAGIHSASDTEHSWPWYGNLTGAFFAGHPALQSGDVYKVSNVSHISINTLPERFSRVDEWYYYDRRPEKTAGLTSLLRVEESSISGLAGFNFSDFHAVSWYQEFEGGRSWYTGMGHTSESYLDDALFQTHVAGGIIWAAGASNSTSIGTTTLIYVPRRIPIAVVLGTAIGVGLLAVGVTIYLIWRRKRKNLHKLREIENP